MISDAPCVELLGDMKTAMEAGDWETNVGLAVKIRHFRHRRTGQDERPCVSILFNSDGPPEEFPPYISHSEKIMQMEVVLVADADLPSEESEEDPTGLAILNRMLAYALMLLRDPANGFSTKVHEIVDGLKDLDDSSQADKGRLTRALSVIYRVSSDDENTKL